MRNAIAIPLLVLCFAFASVALAATTYQYDDLNRLVRVTYDDGTQIDYSYDLAGNRTARTVSGASSATGSVQISVTPASTEWSFTDSLGTVHSGTGNATVPNIPVGPVSLFWTPPSGYGAPSPNPEVRMVPDGGVAGYSQSLIEIPATPTRTQTPIPTSTPTATPTVTPTPTATPVVTPSEFDLSQQAWVDATGVYEYVYVSAWDYTGGTWAGQWIALGDEIGALSYEMPVDHWIGVFIYDVNTSLYTRALYILRNDLSD